MAEFVFADDYILESGKTRDFYVAFMKGMIHKNNNLVGVIQGFGSLMLLEDDLSDSLRENTEQMESAGRTMSELNKKVLTAAGCGRVECTAANLQDMFQFHEEKAEAICRDLGVTFKFQASPGLPAVVVDTTKFSEVFENLVRNAAESAAETEKKAVLVEVFPPGAATSTGHVDMFIRNTSADIPVHKIPEFYEGFYTSKGNDHFGLGLTTAAVLCGQMNIRLGIKCKDGTTAVWLAIPVAK
ncbi:MAG: ATP-binding protein [Verrucomicrobiales bacterium]|nr:ATP-binding protein [Verrucomicrobiales bacterium]